MGWLQVKRWLSFLPVAFVVYILLHYLVYQPDLGGPHAALIVSGRRSNESLVPVAGGRSLQSGPRLLPLLPQEATDPSDASEAPPAAPAASAGGTSRQDNVTSSLRQGSGASSRHHHPSSSTSSVRFESEWQAPRGDAASSRGPGPGLGPWGRIPPGEGASPGGPRGRPPPTRRPFGRRGAAPSGPRPDRRSLALRELGAHGPRSPLGAPASRERAVQRALRTGGFPQGWNVLPSARGPFAYPWGRDPTTGEHPAPDVAGQSGQMSTIHAAQSTSAKSQAQQPTQVQSTGPVPQPRQTVTKKTAVKKNTASVSTSLAINYLKGKTKIGEKYESGFSVPHEELCENNGRELKVLVLITTAPDHEKHRTAVRQTWGHFTVRKDVVMVFVIGRTTNMNIQSNIDRENELYGDIIQANFIDHYSNLTLKTISMFEWVKTYCSESHFVLKTDDDMFINMPLLLSFIDSKVNDEHVMYGRMAKGWKPVRNKKSKYYIDTNTYSKSKYPDFLTGPAYLFTSDVVDEIYQKALDTTFFVLEDVLVTGFVGESLRVRRIGDSRFKNEKIKATDTCNLMKTISTHMVKYEEQFDFYKRTLDGKAKCKTG